jgi:hypothetical protein
LGKPEDIAGALPGQQHLAVFGDLVLPFLGAEQIGRVDVLEPDEHALDAGTCAFLDKIRQLVAKRVDLDNQTGVEFLHLAQVNTAVVDRFPILVAGEIVVGEKEGAQALRVVHPHDLFDVVRERRRDLRPCTLMMVQNEH